MKIAFIGLGIMGSRMAANLLKHNVDLIVFNRSPLPLESLQDKGAIKALSKEEAVAEADIVFTMLANPEVVETIMLGENGALKAMKANAVWADCSTVNPSFTRKSHQAAAKAGVRYLDAPVAGTKPHAANAELTFFIGGEKSELDSVMPYLEMMGKKILHIGETGKGASFKMLVNAMLAQSMIMFSETILLGEKMGIDKSFLLDVVPNLVVSAPFTKFKAEMIRSGDYEVQFPLELMHKDLHLAAVTAYELNQPLYLSNMAKEIFAEANNKGMGRLDFAAIHKFLERN
ncbi:MAG: NAD(P)-dependent oxidoreductase [Bacteroidota bacterium]